MTQLIPITDDRKRDAQVAADWPKRTASLRYAAPSGAPLKLERVIRTTERTTADALLRRFSSAEAVARALVEGDPEIDLDQVGRRLRHASTVYLRPDGTVLYAARVLQVVYTPEGAEKSRQEFLDVEATVAEDSPPLLWSGRLMPVGEVVRKLAFTRKVQLRHVNGLTFDFLFDIAKTLQDADKLLYVGAGPKGQQPLIFRTNGAPYRGFLEGRVQGESYLLVLHLSNLEIKSLHGAAATATATATTTTTGGA